MNTLECLYKLIKRHTFPNKKVLSISKFMEYLIGDINENSFSDTTLYNLYNNTKKLSYDNLNNLASYKNRGKAFISLDIDVPNFIEDANNLLCTRLPHYTRQNDLCSVLNTFVFIHFFNTSNPYILFQYNEKASTPNYVHWTTMEQQILPTLKQNNLLFLTGNPGSGKTQLLINCLPKYSFASYTDIHWLDAPTPSCIPLKEQILSITFIGRADEKLQLNDLLKILKEKASTSILIIDRPELTDEDLSFCKEHLCGLKLKIIITTYRKVLSSDFSVLDINERPDDNLIKIFRSYSPNSILSDDDINKLSKKYDNNVYVLTLIFKSLSIELSKELSKKHSIFIENEICNKLLNEYLVIWDKKRAPKIHTDYRDFGKHTGQQILALIERILFNYDNNSSLIKHISELSIWTKTPISQDLLVDKWGESVINKFIANGILQYYDAENLKLYMPRLIADAIWHQQAIDYNEYSKKLFKFMDMLESGQPLPLPYADLYQLIFNMILRFHFQVITMPSRVNQDTRDTFEGWNILLVDIIELFMRLGNYHYALEILPYLYIARSKKGKLITCSSLRSITKQLLEKQANYMKASSMSEALENMIASIKNISRTPPFKKDATYPVILYLLTHIMRDMADHIVDLTISITGNNLQAKSDGTTINNNFTLLQGLDKFYSTLIKLDPHYAYYLKIVRYYYLTISTGVFYIPKAQTYIDYLLSEADTSPKLRFQIRGLQLYFSVILFYMQNNCSAYDPDLFRVFTFEYNKLYKEFKESIWPYHTSYIFYSCTSLLASYLPCTLHPFTYHNLLKSMKSYKSFNHNQLSLDPEQIEEYDKMINDKILELQQQMILPYGPFNIL